MKICNKMFQEKHFMLDDFIKSRKQNPNKFKI